MTAHTRIAGVLLFLFALTFAFPVLGQTAIEQATCEHFSSAMVPTFKIVRSTRKTTRSSLVLFVSVAPADMTRDHIVALSCRLGKRYSSEQNLFVWIFDSRRAAMRFNPQGEGNDRQTNLAYRALYGFSRQPGAKYGQTIDWRPNAQEVSRWVHIDLGLPPDRK